MKCFTMPSKRKIPWKSCATLLAYLSRYDSPTPSRHFIQLIRGIKRGRRQRQRKRQKAFIYLSIIYFVIRPRAGDNTIGL